MGASNPHPHGQIWATEHVPTIVAREQEALGRSAVLLDSLDDEPGADRRGERPLRGGRTVLGRVAVRDCSSSPVARSAPPCSTSMTPNGTASSTILQAT